VLGDRGVYLHITVKSVAESARSALHTMQCEGLRNADACCEECVRVSVSFTHVGVGALLGRAGAVASKEVGGGRKEGGEEGERRAGREPSC